MPFSRRNFVFSVGLLALGSLSAAYAAQETETGSQPEPQPAAAEVSAPSRQLTIALLMPPDDSPFLAAARIVGNGLSAANAASARPANLLMIEAQKGATIHDQLQAAVLAGADVAVGPIEREAVVRLAHEASLPLPVVALNAAPGKAAPENLIMLSVSTEAEAEWIARLAVRALPAHTTSGALPKVAVITGASSWETRIRDVYEKTIKAAGIAFDVFPLDVAALDDLQKRLEPQLSEADALHLAEASREALAKATDDASRRRAAKAALRERRTLIAASEPPYQAALLALSAQDAGLVRNRLPQRMRVWATSASNPGDPLTSSTATTLAYDLDELVFSECPLVVRYDAAGFEARFAAAMPYSLSAKRLFALGADAREIAAQWSQKKTIIQYSGETGRLELNRLESPVVAREPQTVVVTHGRLAEIDPQAASREVLPAVEPPPDPSTMTFVNVREMEHNVRREGVKSIILDDPGAGPAPTPMLPNAAPARRPAAPAASVLPGVPLTPEAVPQIP